MSGTSLDGVDAALVNCTGRGLRTRVHVEAWQTTPYPDALRARLTAACAGRCSPVKLSALNFEVGTVLAAAAVRLIRRQQVSARALTAIASHGQTIVHQPPGRGMTAATLQIGEGAVIAERTGVLTICDFRVADMAAGGQGAPLVPYADYVLLHSPARARAVQNLGGIANVTYLPHRGGLAAVRAFDTGPGNVMIDAAMRRVTKGKQTMDASGAYAARGQASRRLLSWLMAHPFLQRRPPKSADREEFLGTFFEATLERAKRLGLRSEDLVATLTAFTAESIAAAYPAFLPRRDPVREVILGGGGVRNRTLVGMLGERLPGITLRTHEEVGLPSKAKEAIAFAILGDAALQGVPANVPGATGAHPAILGKLCFPPPGGGRMSARRRRGRRAASESGFREQSG